MRKRERPDPVCLLVAAGAALLSACAQLPSPDQTAQATAEPAVAQQELIYEWNGDGRRISRIDIDTDAQKAVFYAGTDEIGWSHVATGINRYETPKGRFRITEKVPEKRSNLYGRIYDADGELRIVNARRGLHAIPPGGSFRGANMPYFMRLTKSGVGMHGGPIPDPGEPASHGCIRLPHDLAPIVFDHVRIGTPVRITGSG